MTSRVIEGKTKTIAPAFNDPTVVLITTKNSLTGNDGLLQENLPLAIDKTEQTCNVFGLLEQQGIPTAFQKQTSETSFLASACAMLPLECVARRIPYGSYLKRHPSIQPPTASTIAGIGGGGASGKFKEPMLEYFHKHSVVLSDADATPVLMLEATAREKYMKDGKWTREVYTDPLIIHNSYNNKWRLHPAKMNLSGHSGAYLMEMEPLETEKTMRIIEGLVTAAFKVLEAAWNEFEITLVDLKVEVGRRVDTKELVIADVIDNDSWRIWPEGDPTKQLDKQAFREGAEPATVLEKYRIVTGYTKRFCSTPGST